MKKNYGAAGLLTDDYSYKTLGIKKEQPEKWEDGLRTTGKEGTYEWWYVDAEFTDGTTAVIMFYTKNGIDCKGPSHPTASIDITYKDGKKIVRTVHEEKGTHLNASKEFCDVTIANTSLKMVGNDYVLTFKDGDLTFNATMKSILPMWRPDTGHSFYGDKKEKYMAWFVAQPQFEIEAELTIGNVVIRLQGKGYHDHNWGNIGMNEIINNWYWARGRVGDYYFIAADVIAEKSYNSSRLANLFLAKGNTIIDIDQTKIVVKRSNAYQHEQTNKEMHNNITFIHELNDGTVYTITLKREKDILYASLLDLLPKPQKTIAKLLGANPTYVRILGTVTITIEKDGNKEAFSGEGLWEQMYFGKNKTSI